MNIDNKILNNKFVLKSSILILPIIIWALTPFLTFNSFYRLFVIISLISIFIYYRGIINKFSISIFLLLSLCWVIHLFSGSEENLRHVHLSVFLILSIVSHYFLHNRFGVNNIVLTIILILNLFTIFNTSYALISDMNVSRQFVRSDEFSKALANKGIGGYGFVYMNVVFLPVLVFFIKKILNEGKNYIILGLSILNIFGILFLIWKAQYLIALGILFIYGILYYLKFSLKNPIKSLIIITLCLLFFSVNYIIFIENSLENTRYFQKYIGITSILSGGVGNAVIEGRLEPYIKSILTISNNPLIGVLKFSFSKIGAHSQILDLIAQFGIFLGSIIVYFIFKLPLIFLKNINKQYKFEILLVIIGLIILCLFNTLPLEASIPIIFISLIFNKKNNVQK